MRPLPSHRLVTLLQLIRRNISLDTRSRNWREKLLQKVRLAGSAESGAGAMVGLMGVGIDGSEGFRRSPAIYFTRPLNSLV
jgi:hypothetical protein